jgi:hypothetical protein
MMWNCGSGSDPALTSYSTEGFFKMSQQFLTFFTVRVEFNVEGT